MWFMKYFGVGRHAFNQPYVPADDAVVADDGSAAQYRRAGVDHHIVFHRGMPLFGLHAFFHTQSAEVYALVELHPVANAGRLSDDNARAVVDKKIGAYRRRGMNVDTRFGVCVFGQNTR